MFRIPLSLAAGVSMSTGAVLYSENFTTDLTGVQPIAAENWAGVQGSETIAPVAVIHNNGNYRAGTVGGASAATPVLDDYLFAQNQSGATAGIDYFLYTTSTVTAFAPNDYTSLTAVWNRNGDAVAGHYLTVQVGGNWYVSQTGYTTSGPGQGATPTPFNLLTATWRNLINGATLEIGTTTSTYSDLFGSGAQITGVGFYIDNLAVNASSARTIRIDDIVIDGVPESSAAVLSILGLTALAGRRRR